MEQPRRLVGIEQRFGEQLGVGHRFSALYVQETGRMPRFLNKASRTWPRQWGHRPNQYAISKDPETPLRFDRAHKGLSFGV